MMACSAPSMGSFTALPPVAIKMVFACSSRHNWLTEIDEASSFTALPPVAITMVFACNDRHNWQQQFDETSHALVLPYYHVSESLLQSHLRMFNTSALTWERMAFWIRNTECVCRCFMCGDGMSMCLIGIYG